MVNEKNIKDLIVSKLGTDLSEYKVYDFPFDINKYMPKHPKGEILIKAIGYRPTQYIDRNNQMNVLSFGSFVVIEYQFRLDLINKNFRSQDEILDTTKTIVDSMWAIDCAATIEGAGQFMVIDVGEALYHEEKLFQFRTMIFTLPVMTYLGD
ncbi:MAG: hypothetical protein M1419_01205 [Bacteroidetes bacterium]|nr:hypothetical protein [Bacteroidota bacterium]